jgi:Tfp pilus assembly protein PilF
MNIKTLVRVFFVFLIGFFSGCGKQERNKKLAITHYKLALVELEDSSPGNMKYKKALSHVDNAITYEHNAQYYALRATLLFLLGQKLEAKDIFHKALALCSDSRVKTEIQNNYACLLAQGGRADEALVIWKGLEKSKDYLSPEVSLVNQAKYYVMCGEHEVAREKLVSAIDCAPSYLDAHYYLALLEWQGFKDKNKSMQYAQTALFLDSSHKGARDLLDVVRREA